MPNCETKFGNYFKLPNPGLRAYFEHVVRGQPDEYRTPFFKGKSLQSILKGWDVELSKINSEWPSLYDFENDLAKKVGPMSIMRPLNERMEDIDHYYDLINLDQIPISDEAMDRVLAEWKQAGGLRMRSQSTTVDWMKKSTNSGSPYFTKRSRVVKDTVPALIAHDSDGTTLQFLNAEQGSIGSKWAACAVLGWRGQEGGPKASDVKQRVVWMFPFAINIAELQVYQPLIVAAQKHNLVPAWVGMDAVDEAITKLFDTKGKDDLVICTDFSKFDQHFNPSCQDAARRMLQRLFTGDKSMEEWLESVFPVKYDIPLAYNYGEIRTGKHGMASGSGGTNADETLVHRALQHEAAISAGAQLNLNSQCLGDDGILTYPGCTVEDVVQAYSRHGLEMNPDKQYASKQDCVYLRRWHHRDYRINGVCVGVYSTNRALGRLCEQERYYDPEVWGPKMVALRQLSIIENCKFHPLREKFADYCMKGDKFRLGLDIPGFFDNIERFAKEATDYMPDFLGYTRTLAAESRGGKVQTGIQDWWIVNYLKSKR
uniref:RNA-dependent RNA polymerase n=1 Tax=Pink-eared duck picobirnavirus TaxID=2592517 RepID=A0A5B8JT63_9VIRU|nr:RNA-dependent RNA polymerase [Pink-eared duck picobirnavirus]